MNTVQPIRNTEKWSEILETLERDRTEHGRRKYRLVAVGLFTGLRISDMVGLRVKHCMGDHITLVELKTGKRSYIAINPTLREIFRNEFADMGEEDYILPSMRKAKDGQSKHCTRRDAYNDLQRIYNTFGINGAYGCHTLRKSFGWLHYQTNKDLETLRIHFNHASCDVTRRYIGVTQ